MTSAILFAIMPEDYNIAKRPQDWTAHFVVCCDSEHLPKVRAVLQNRYAEIIDAISSLNYFDASILLGKMLSVMSETSVVASPILEMGYVYQSIAQ